ncbi:copper-binding protein [Sulfitobacter mediterraneus]|uniref:copper-binding protein n=1 Tax=Sulfitobacter mediterraneus TaxID=83219 RepID=UPI002491B856|nr:copper-binding protein [Sulfitobacter mediterraneus]
MKNLLLTTAIALTFGMPAYAAGTHSGGHDEVKTEEAHGHSDGGHGNDGHGDAHAMMAAGMPGMADDVNRTIDVIMRETDDGQMIFEPSTFEFEKGETIRFNVMNNGELEHEFVIDDVEGNAKHKMAMAEMDMEHDDPNSVRLDEGKSGEVIWKFANAGTFEFACLIPGHYESGMHGPIKVSQKMAQADVEYTQGKIKKVDAKGGKVTIVHGPLLNLDMPAMTMVFRADESMIARMSEGQDIEFVAEPVKGKLTVTQLK